MRSKAYQKLQREHNSYHSAITRCENYKADNFKYYGGRGIKFKFKSFDEFYLELGLRPRGKTLDRINNNGHYEKGNVRWSTRKEQIYNRSSSLSKRGKSAFKHALQNIEKQQ